jgi:hypothetical protein
VFFWHAVIAKAAIQTVAKGLIIFFMCVFCFLGLMKNNVLQNSDVSNSLTKNLGNLVANKLNLK